MKLLKCHVSSFGKLKDFTLDLADGFNVINQENGWGKTTLCTFITAMFYGLDNGRKSLSDSDRKKYAPWNSVERFGGYVEFSWKDYTYRLERFFGKKEADDTVLLTDLKTGKVNKNVENLGERIFGIDKEGFYSSTYFSQKNLDVIINSQMTAKIASVMEVEGGETFEKALKKLEEKSKNYKKVGDKGLIPDLIRSIYQNNEQIELAKKAEQTILQVKDEILVLNEKAEKLNKQIGELSTLYEKANSYETLKVKRERLNFLKDELSVLQEELNVIKIKLNGQNVSDNEIDNYKKIYNDLITLNAKINSQKASLVELENIKVSTSNKSQNKILSVCLLALFSALLIVGVIGFFASFPIAVSIALTVIGGVGGILGGVYAYKEPNEKNRDGVSPIILRTKNEILENQKLLDKYTDDLTDFANRFRIDSSDYLGFLNQIKNLNVQAVNLDKEIAEKTENFKKLSSENLGTDEIENYNLQEIKENLDSAREDIIIVNRSLSDKNASLSRLEEYSQSVVDFEIKRSELNEKLEVAKSEYDILLKTIEMLKKADENMKAKFRLPLQESFNDYAKLIDEKFSKQFEVDVNMDVLVREDVGSKDTEYYSQGYQSLFEVCKRFALIKVLFDNEKPFMILDDPFVNMDKDKIEGALNLLKSFSKEYQIIYFTCHESRC